MVAVISRLYGLQHMETAEDIVSETFLQAAESWGMTSMPENPRAWLYAVARQKTLYRFRRNKIYVTKVIPSFVNQQDSSFELDFSQQNIKDSQLQMLFAVCNPVIASEAQIGLALRILCGFGIEEIAEAFLTNKETINKRLFRAKEKLREEKVQLVPVDSMDDLTTDVNNRLDSVLHIIYLLFNEGYYSKTQNQVLRKEFAFEAIRLALLLIENKNTNHPKVNALLALMCFHASRFEAREQEDALALYELQDEKLWDQALIAQGVAFLERSASGDELTSYHLEARIAYLHCSKEDTLEKWKEILATYDQLLQINYSPSVHLNRLYAVYKVDGPHAALAAAAGLQFPESHFYHLLLGELNSTIDPGKALQHYENALLLSKSEIEKQVLLKKITDIRNKRRDNHSAPISVK